MPDIRRGIRFRHYMFFMRDSEYCWDSVAIMSKIHVSLLYFTVLYGKYVGIIIIFILELTFSCAYTVVTFKES